MGRRRGSLTVALAALTLVGRVSAELSMADLLSQITQCPTSCLVQGISNSVCDPTNTTCTCADKVLFAEVTQCVTSNCTVIEGLHLQNLTSAGCGEPVRDRSTEYKNITLVLAVLSGVTVLLRMGFKIWTKLPLCADDWFTLATFLACIPSMVINVNYVTQNGLGQDIWTLDPEQITNFGRFFYVLAVLYFVYLTLLKFALLFFYLRIFPSRNAKRLLWGTIAFNCIYGLFYFFVTVFQCWPVPYFWWRWDGEHKGRCMDIRAYTWSNAGISIGLDVWMLAIPLWYLKRLQLDWKKKVGVALMFFVGTFVTIVSILRLRSLISFSKGTANLTWTYTDVSIWSTVEIEVGTICVCMPTMRLVLVKIAPKVFATTKSYYAKYGGSSSDGTKRRSGHRRGSSATTPQGYPLPQYPSSDGDAKPDRGGILYNTTIDVRYEDSGDEERLVGRLVGVPKSAVVYGG